MIVVEIDINAKALIAFLKDINTKLTNLSVPLKQAGLLMIKSIDTNFRVMGRPEKWKPLAPSTLKKRRGGSSRVLQDTGRLKGSFSVQASNAEVRIGTTNEYAPVHNFGSTSTRSKAWGKPSKSYTLTIPQRKFMLFQDEDRKIIDKVFIDFIGKTLTKGIVKIG